MATAKHTHTAPAEAQSRPLHLDEKSALMTRVGAFQDSPQGRKLHEASAELGHGLSILAVLLRSLQAAGGMEEEEVVLGVAIERLEAAHEHLEHGDGMAARAYQPEGVQS